MISVYIIHFKTLYVNYVFYLCKVCRESGHKVYGLQEDPCLFSPWLALAEIVTKLACCGFSTTLVVEFVNLISMPCIVGYSLDFIDRFLLGRCPCLLLLLSVVGKRVPSSSVTARMKTWLFVSLVVVLLFLRGYITFTAR